MLLKCFRTSTLLVLTLESLESPAHYLVNVVEIAVCLIHYGIIHLILINS